MQNIPPPVIRTPPPAAKLPGMTTVNCKDCKKVIPLEGAYHAQPQGFRCRDCHAAYGVKMTFFGLAAGVIIVVIAIAATA